MLFCAGLALQAEPVDEAEVNGRVYHDEHFNHGVHYADEGTAPAPVGRKVTFNAALSKNMDSERMTATTKPVQLGAPVRVEPEGEGGWA